jgi:hypothetical protein
VRPRIRSAATPSPPPSRSPLLEKARVDLVLRGHEHLYERFYPLREGRRRDAGQDPDYIDPDGVIYVTTGGGGAPLYPPAEASAAPAEAAAGGGPALSPDLSARAAAVHHAVLLRITPQLLTIEARLPGNVLFDRATIRKSAGR